MSIHQHDEHKIQHLEQNVVELQKEMVGIKHILENQGQVLVEIKNVLVAQTKTLDEVFRMKDKLYFLNRDFELLEGNFKKHEEKCHTKDKADEGFNGRIKGGLSVALFLFSLIQLTIGYYVVQKDENLKNVVVKMENNSKEISDLRTKIEVTKQKIERGGD